MVGNLLHDLLRRGLAAADSVGVKCVLVGGVAMILSGRNRSTRDLDVLVSELPESLTEACALQGLEHDPSRDRIRLKEVTVYRYWLPLEFVDLRLSFDVQLGHTPYHAEVLRRARPIVLLDREVGLSSHEDLILMKLIAFRPVDRADCIELVELYPDLDREYIVDWVARLGLQERWQEILAVVGGA